MSSEWQECLLEDVADLNGGYAFKSEEYTAEGHFVLRTVNITDDGRINRSGAAFVSEDSARKYERFSLRNLDTLFVMVGATLGKTGLVKPCDLPALLNQNMWVIRAKNSDIDPLFLHYAFKVLSQPLSGLASGSARGFVKRDDFRRMKICLPQLSEQRQVSALLGSLDDRITLLRETNATLEAIAQALFKSWFVDFDPVRAKMEGRVPEGIDEATAALFPDSFEDTELGEVPSGWNVKPVYETAEFINGAAYKAFEPNAERRGLPIIKIAELKSGVTLQTAYSAVKMPSKYLIETGDILFSWSGNPDTSIDMFVWAHEHAWLNQHIFRVLPNQAGERSYLLQLMRHLKPVFTELARDKQTTGLGHVTVADLKRLMVVWPDIEVMREFAEIGGCIQQRVLANEQQANLLVTLRDTLLPRLISGQLRMSESSQQFVEVVA